MLVLVLFLLLFDFFVSAQMAKSDLQFGCQHRPIPKVDHNISVVGGQTVLNSEQLHFLFGFRTVLECSYDLFDVLDRLHYNFASQQIIDVQAKLLVALISFVNGID